MRVLLPFLVILILVASIQARPGEVREESVEEFDPQQEQDENAEPSFASEDLEEEEEEEEEQQQQQDRAQLEAKMDTGSSHANVRRGFRGFFYNYLDEMAMSICASIPPLSPGEVLAIRRTCSGKITCNTICSAPFMFAHNKQDWIKAKKWQCLESLHVYKSRPVLADNKYAYTDSYKLGLQVFRYHNCHQTLCGPNYCCCQYN